MACDRNKQRILRIAARLGLSKAAGQSAYLISGAAIGLTAFAALGRFLERRADSARQETAGSSKALPAAEARPAIKPAAPKKGQRCASCGADAGKPGLWYTLDGKQYCVDCAPEAAKKANVALIGATNRRNPAADGSAEQKRKAPAYGPDARPTPSTTDGAPVLPTRHIVAEKASAPLRIDLPDGSSKVLKLRGVYALKDRQGKDTGLAITPVINAGSGEPYIVPNSWQITHTVSGQQVADLVFRTPDEALALGVLLGQFNWLKGDRILRRELATIKATIAAFKKAHRELQRQKIRARAGGSLPATGKKGELLDTLLVDAQRGEVVRVLSVGDDDLLTVSDRGGDIYEISLADTRSPEAQDYEAGRMGVPLTPKEVSAGMLRCANCDAGAAEAGEQGWYRLAGRAYCGNCARESAEILNLFLPEDLV